MAFAGLHESKGGTTPNQSASRWVVLGRSIARVLRTWMCLLMLLPCGFRRGSAAQVETSPLCPGSTRPRCGRHASPRSAWRLPGRLRRARSSAERNRLDDAVNGIVQGEPAGHPHLLGMPRPPKHSTLPCQISCLPWPTRLSNRSSPTRWKLRSIGGSQAFGLALSSATTSSVVRTSAKMTATVASVALCSSSVRVALASETIMHL